MRRTIQSRLILAAAAAIAFMPGAVFSQTTRPTTRPTAAPPPKVTQATLRGVKSGEVRIRALPAVLDARARRQTWQQASQAAESRIKSGHLRAQLAKRLSGIKPQVEETLKANPQDNAIVTVAVYRNAKTPGDDAMIAVTFQGLGSQIGGSFLTEVLNNLPVAPQGRDIPKGLVLDSHATSYLVCFMGNHGLRAGDVSQAQMHRSIRAAATTARQNLAPSGQQASVPIASRQERAQARQLEHEQIAQQARQASSIQRGATGATTDLRAYPAASTDGFYYPGIGVPVVILPNEYPDNTRWRAAQRRREEALEKQYRHAPPQPQSKAEAPHPAQDARIPATQK